MIRLRPYQNSDAQTIITWIGDERSFRQWCADRYEYYPITADDMNRQYDAADGDRFFPMTAYDETGIVGHLIMRYTDDEKRVLRFGFIIVDDKKRGQGIGRQMLKSSIDFAFKILRVEKITLGVFENNPQAYRCYCAAGFHETDTQEAEYYPIFGENWKCTELEMTKKDHEKSLIDNR